MKKYIFLFCFLVFISSISTANTDIYRIDDNAIESLFAQAEEISICNKDIISIIPELKLVLNNEQIKKEKDPAIALILSIVIPYATMVNGVHRLYLGTDTIVFVAYLISFGGCGIISCGDTIALLIAYSRKDISKYVDNPALIMW